MDVCEYRFTFQLCKKANLFHFLSVRWIIIEHAFASHKERQKRPTRQANKHTIDSHVGKLAYSIDLRSLDISMVKAFSEANVIVADYK